jgi:hypothetical protein
MGYGTVGNIDLAIGGVVQPTSEGYPNAPKPMLEPCVALLRQTSDRQA